MSCSEDIFDVQFWFKSIDDEFVGIFYGATGGDFEFSHAWR